MTKQGDRLRKAREGAGVASAAEAARQLGVIYQTYVGHENGSRSYDYDAAVAYGRRFGVDPGWLLKGEPSKSRPKQPLTYEQAGQKSIGTETGVRGIPDDSSPEVDVTAGMGAGGLSLTADATPDGTGATFAAEHVRDHWRLPPRLLDAMTVRPHDLAVLPVQGDSMYPTLTEGDFVFVDTRHHFPSPDGVYALADEFGGVVVKRLEVASKPSDQEVSIRIISDNDRHQPKEFLLSELHVIGRVVRRFTTVR